MGEVFIALRAREVTILRSTALMKYNHYIARWTQAINDAQERSAGGSSTHARMGDAYLPREGVMVSEGETAHPNR